MDLNVFYVNDTNEVRSKHHFAFCGMRTPELRCPEVTRYLSGWFIADCLELLTLITITGLLHLMSTFKSCLLLGATGNIGKRVLQRLLSQDVHVKAVVRKSVEQEHPKLTVVKTSILDMPVEDLRLLVSDVDVIVSCLGFGALMYGGPTRLKLTIAQRICGILEHEPNKTKTFIMLNGAAARHPSGGDASSWIDGSLLSLMRLLIAPHADMEETLAYLQTQNHVNWIALRPGLFVDSNSSSYSLTDYRECGLFSGRVASRDNVADGLVQLAIDKSLQHKWNRKMPVLLDDT